AQVYVLIFIHWMDVLSVACWHFRWPRTSCCELKNGVKHGCKSEMRSRVFLF
uniref:Tetraspanin n=1 Tax=Parascaris univalens TaxID=6257 RepID=A0A915A1I4_PARUN